MRCSLAVLVGTLLTLAGFACMPTDQPQTLADEEVPTETDASAVQALFQAYVKTVNSGDAEGWLTFFTEDAAMMPPNEPAVIGREAIRAWGQPYFDAFDMQETLQPQEIQVEGDWALVRLDGTFQATPKAGGEAAEEAFQAIWILKRQSDGSWKGARTIWNAKAAPPDD